MSIPDFQTLMLPLLQLSSAGEIAVGDAVRQLADEFSLSEDERATLLPSGRQTTFANRVHWAKTYLGKGGLVAATGRGRFALTEEVKRCWPLRHRGSISASWRDSKSFSSSGLGLLWKRGENRRCPPSPPSRKPPLRTKSCAARTGRSKRRSPRISWSGCAARRPPFFERLIVRLLLAMGYGGSVAEAGRALGRSGDDGVDGVIDQDPLGLDRVYVQAKRYGAANSVGAGAVRDFFGSLDRHKAAKGLFVTTSAFTASARDTAEYLSKRIVLVDGEQLGRMMVRHEVGCRVEEVLAVKKLDEEFFDDG